MEILLCLLSQINISIYSDIIIKISKKLHFPVKIHIISTETEIIQQSDLFTKVNLVFLDLDSLSNTFKREVEKFQRENSSLQIIGIAKSDKSFSIISPLKLSAFILTEDSMVRKQSELYRVFSQAKDNYQESFFFEIRNRKEIELKNLSLLDIIYLECINRQIFLSTKENKYQLRNTEFERVKKKFVENDFIEIHRMVAVNRIWIDSFAKETILLKNGESLPVSRRREKNVRQELQKYAFI